MDFLSSGVKGLTTAWLPPPGAPFGTSQLPSLFTPPSFPFHSTFPPLPASSLPSSSPTSSTIQTSNTTRLGQLLGKLAACYRYLIQNVASLNTDRPGTYLLLTQQGWSVVFVQKEPKILQKLKIHKCMMHTQANIKGVLEPTCEWQKMFILSKVLRCHMATFIVLLGKLLAEHQHVNALRENIPVPAVHHCPAVLCFSVAEMQLLILPLVSVIIFHLLMGAENSNKKYTDF